MEDLLFQDLSNQPGPSLLRTQVYEYLRRELKEEKLKPGMSVSMNELMSNLGMVRVGASTFPAKKTRLFEKLLVGADAFVYHKQKSAGAISDSLSTEPSSYVGSAVDFYANWRMSTDLAWTVRYGVFMPGDAFDDKTDRQQFFTGVTLNF